jgi:hypothetical protein
LRIDSKSLLVLYTFGLIGLIGGSLFLIDGARQSYVQYVQSKRWPAVEARVVRCSLVEVPILYRTGSTRLPSHHGIESYIGCRLAYDVGGVARQTSTRPGSSVITDRQPLDFVTPKVTPAKLSGWVFRHRPGSTLTIHYDPSHPDNISLAGADDEIKDMLPHERLLFGFLLAITGLVMILVARRVGKRLIRDSMAAPGSQVETDASSG